MKRQKALIAAGICLLLLSGCGGTSLPETIDKTTIVIDDEGKVTAYLVDNFAKDYYDISELTSMAKEDAAAYSAEMGAGENAASVEAVEMLENGTDVRITYQFDSAETYADYMGGVLFYGTVEEAKAAGYDLTTAPLNSVKDGTTVTENWLETEGLEKHIVITDQLAEFYCPYTVTHVSADAFYNTDGSVTNDQPDDVVYVLLKK